MNIDRVIRIPEPPKWEEPIRNPKNPEERKLYRDIQLENGKKYEDYIQLLLYNRYGIRLGNTTSKWGQELIGENLAGWEIKWDHLATYTGNLFLEYAEIGIDGSFHPSGFRRGNSQYLLIGDVTWAYLFETQKLQELQFGEWAQYDYREKETSQALRVPRDVAIMYAVCQFYMGIRKNGE